MCFITLAEVGGRICKNAELTPAGRKGESLNNPSSPPQPDTAVFQHDTLSLIPPPPDPLHPAKSPTPFFFSLLLLFPTMLCRLLLSPHSILQQFHDCITVWRKKSTIIARSGKHTRQWHEPGTAKPTPFSTRSLLESIGVNFVLAVQSMYAFTHHRSDRGTSFDAGGESN